jgi:O-antigen ligase
MPEAMLSGGRRAVHSLYFQCLAERGYIGFIIFMSLVFSNFRLMRKTKRTILLNGELTLYYQGIALESSFIVFLTASAFINRLHAEILYMLMLFIGCFGNIYYIKPGKLRTKEA